ncbi:MULTISPECIES: RidA family protein [unclassified Rhodococcus (in: high G+C Gram-positive bacteria)]|uniref:RidA family protein n=1 Tax=Rhodococcus sp. SJ-3 TaxID=3454628 RepID=UPI003F7A6C04
MSSSRRVPVPQGRYVAAVLAGDTIRTAGMTPRLDGALTVTGRVGAEVSVEEAFTAAALAARNALVAVRSVLPAGSRLRPAEMVVYVAAAPGFTSLSTVADGASDVIADELGVDNLPARSAIGVYTLPGGASVEVALTAVVVAEQ